MPKIVLNSSCFELSNECQLSMYHPQSIQAEFLSVQLNRSRVHMSTVGQC